MKKLYIITLFFLIKPFCANATINDIVLTDSTIEKFVMINTKDTLVLNEIYENTSDSISKTDFLKIVDILHKNLDTTYVNNQKSYAVAQLMIQKFLLAKPEIITTYKNFSESGTAFFEDNLKIYLTRRFFQFFYDNNAQNELLRTEIQEKMQPHIIDGMFKKSLDLQDLQDALIFIARNSHYKLFNL